MDLPENTVHVWGVQFKKRNHSREIAHAILSKYLPPQEIIFENNSHGKPYLKNHALEFNFSHAGDYLLLAVTLKNKIGIDIEREKNNKDFLAIAKRFFAESEYKALTALPETAQKQAFYRCWTLKEAFIK